MTKMVTFEKGWVLWFQCVKDRFVLPTFWSEYSDLLQDKHLTSPLLTWGGWWEWKSRYRSVCVGFL